MFLSFESLVVSSLEKHKQYCINKRDVKPFLLKVADAFLRFTQYLKKFRLHSSPISAQGK